VSSLLVCAGLRIETRALKGAGRVVWVGMGAKRLPTPGPDEAVAVAGFGGALDDGLRPGDVLVADEVRAPDAVYPCTDPKRLAEEIAALGVTTRIGPLFTADHIVRGHERERLAKAGARAVDMETAPVAAAAAGRPLAAVRVIVDTPSSPLLRPGTVRHGFAARAVLRRLGPALTAWAASLDT
jgi:4-hydroxy-3-methylbut-2-enyl diphosphate reductase